MGPGVYFFHFAALPGVYLSPCVYLSPALIRINTAYGKTSAGENLRFECEMAICGKPLAVALL